MPWLAELQTQTWESKKIQLFCQALTQKNNFSELNTNCLSSLK